VLHFRESVWTYPASLKYLAPKFLLYSEKSTELFGRSTDDRSERFCLEFRANLRVVDNLLRSLTLPVFSRVLRACEDRDVPNLWHPLFEQLDAFTHEIEG
jgi:hypothetical protein